MTARIIVSIRNVDLNPYSATEYVNAGAQFLDRDIQWRSVSFDVYRFSTTASNHPQPLLGLSKLGDIDI